MTAVDRSALRVRVASATGVILGGAVFLVALTDLRWGLTRTANQAGWFSNFYDLQAQAFLDGRLDVPEGSLGIEGFVVDGRTYTYFAPFPSLLRIPVLLVTDEFTGRLTMLSMALAWTVLAAFVVGLVWRTRRWFRGTEPVSRLEAVLAAVVIAATVGGTVLTFDAALPWVYHEAYLWAEALAVGGLYWLVRTLEQPTTRHAVWMGVLAMGAIMTRIPAGWAVSGATLLVALWLLSPARRQRHGRLWALFLTAGTIPLAAGVLYNMLRFDHPWLFPLENQVWTEVNARRREALAANGGTITGPQFLETSLANYFRPDGVRFVDHLPWITLPAEPAQAHGGAFLDQSYRTGSVPATMPLLFLLTALAVVGLAVLWRRQRTRPLAFVLLGGIGVSAGVMGYGYLSHRYLSDFVPGLTAGAAIGVWVLADLLRRRSRAAKAGAVGVVVVLAVFGMAANLAIGLDTARLAWRGERLVHWVDAQRATSSAASLAARVHRGEGPPEDGRTDDLYVRGDCAALYLNTGDAYEPWVLVQQRADVLVVRLPEELGRSRTAVATVSGSTDRSVVLETAPPRRVRLTYSDDGVDFRGPWVDPYVGEDLRVGIGVDTRTSRAVIGSTPGGRVGSVPFTEWGTDWLARPGDIRWTVPSSGVLDDGVTVEVVPGRPLGLCQRVLDSAGMDG